jgi:hypothetical protein
MSAADCAAKFPLLTQSGHRVCTAHGQCSLKVVDFSTYERNGHVTVSSNQLDTAIEVLSSAASELQLTRFERISYRALMVSTDVCMASFVVFAAIVTLWDRPGESDYAVILMLIALVYPVSLLVAIVSLTLNIPLLRKTFRERAKLEELGLSSLSRSLWKESRGRGALFGFCLGWLVGFVPLKVLTGLQVLGGLRLGILLSLVVVACFLIARGQWVSWGRGALFGACIGLLSLILVHNILVLTNFIAPKSEITTGDGDDVLMWLVFFVLVPCCLIAAQYLRNHRERMEQAASAEELKKALQGLQRRNGSGVVSLPAEFLEKTAKIESLQIAKQRKDAILESVDSPPTGYAIAFDRTAIEQRATLSFADRVELEDLVAQLSTEGTQVEPQVGTGQGRTKSNRVEIDYVIDNDSRSIRVIAVRHVGEVSHASVNGGSHA